MKKFPKIKYPNDSETDGLLNGKVVVTEKLDGANFRFTFTEDGEIVSGSRNVTFTEDGDPLPLEDINRAFRHAIEYLRETIPEDARSDFSHVTLYGEALHRHSLEYEDIDYEHPPSGPPYPGGDTPNVVIFDAHGPNDWYHYAGVQTVANDLNLEQVPLLDDGDPDEVSFDVPDESVFGGPPEGIVVRRVDGSVRAKKVTDEFRESNAVAFNDPSKAQSDAAEFVAMYVTKPRIEKNAYKLVDEADYDSLAMEMMRDLPERVLRDVMAEEGWDLLTNDFEAEWDDDFKGSVRSKASKKCVRVLKSELNQI